MSDLYSILVVALYVAALVMCLHVVKAQAIRIRIRQLENRREEEAAL